MWFPRTAESPLRRTNPLRYCRRRPVHTPFPATLPRVPYRSRCWRRRHWFRPDRQPACPLRPEADGSPAGCPRRERGEPPASHRRPEADGPPADPLRRGSRNRPGSPRRPECRGRPARRGPLPLRPVPGEQPVRPPDCCLPAVRFLPWRRSPLTEGLLRPARSPAACPAVCRTSAKKPASAAGGERFLLPCALSSLRLVCEPIPSRSARLRIYFCIRLQESF